MPSNYYVNKVLFGNDTVMDISDTTASPEDVAEGEVFYAANGARSVGTGTGGSYILPTASANTLGGVKVGDNLSIDNNGVLTAQPDNAKQNIELAVPIDMLSGTKLTVESALQGLNNEKISPIELTQLEYEALPISEKENPNKLYFVKKESRSMISVSWPINIVGSCVWGDENGIAYSYGSDQYFLNNGNWTETSWIGLSNFYGESIWTDGTNTYYSEGINQYVADADTWEPMSWSGLNNFNASNIWKRGNDIYYSLYNYSTSTASHYKLNGTTWEPVVWGGNTEFSGAYVWTDGTETYYSAYSENYKLDGTTWIPMTWIGLTDFAGNNVWTDGTNIYYSAGYDHYILNGTTWTPITWNGITFFDGNNIWTDGTDIYYSNGSSYKASFYGAVDIYYKNSLCTNLPVASANVLGGVKIGANLSIDSNGVLSATGGGGTSYTAGDGIDIENTTISLDMDYLTASRLGVISEAEKGANGGVATLGNDGKILSSQLPSTSGSVTEKELHDTVGWIVSKNLGNFIDNKYINDQGEVVDRSGCAATINPIIIENDKQYKIYGDDTFCGYAVWNESTLVRKEINVASGDIINITGGDRFYAEIYGLGDVTVEHNKPMVLYADETDTSYESYHKTVKEEFEDTRLIIHNLNQEKATTVRLTQAQYNALTNEQKHDTTKVYFITDGQSGGGSSTVIEQETVETSFPLQHEHGINRLIKYNLLNIVVIDLILDSVTATAWSTIIGTIPEGYRPQSRIRICGAYGAAVIPYDITPNGAIVSSSNLSNTEVWLHGFWYIG